MSDRPSPGDLFATFLNQMHAIQAAFPSSLLAVQAYEASLRKEVATFLKKYGKQVNDTTFSYSVSDANYLEASRFTRTHSRIGAAERAYVNSIYAGVFATYDAFVRSTIEYILVNRPEINLFENKQIRADDALRFDSIDELRRKLIQEFLDDLLRENYTEQIRIIRDRLGVSLKPEQMECWPAFVEASQRRHLKVHSGSKVTTDYLRNCEAAGYTWPDGDRPELGEEIITSPQRLQQTCDLVSEVAIRFAYAVLRQVFKEEAASIDNTLSDQIYVLLEDDQWSLAQKLGEFGLTMKHASADSRLRLTINTAQAYKWAGEEAECTRLLDKEDWTAVDDRYKIALAALREDHVTTAALIERQLVEDGDSRSWRQNIVGWPLFARFRESQDCRQLMATKCGGEMEQVESPKRSRFSLRTEDVLPNHLLQLGQLIETMRPGAGKGSGSRRGRTMGRKTKNNAAS